MNYATDFKSIKDQVSSDEWNAYQLEQSCRSQVDAMTARTDLTMPGENVLAHTAHLYQPGTRRSYGVLEWPAMLRRLDADQHNSGYPPYWH